MVRSKVTQDEVHKCVLSSNSPGKVTSDSMDYRLHDWLPGEPRANQTQVRRAGGE